MNRAPPRSDAPISRRPPCSSAACRTIASPSPAPPFGPAFPPDAPSLPPIPSSASLPEPALPPSPPVPPAPPSQVLGEMVWLRSAHDGLFYSSVNVGDEVVEGQTLGRLADYLGETLEEVKAPASGPVLFLVTTLAMNNGDPLLAVGRVR